MAKGVSHRGQLEQLRDHLCEERRKAVQKLGTAPISSKNFTLARFVTLQRAFDAAERAIRDEIVEESKRTAEPTKQPEPSKAYSSLPELEDT